MDSENTPPAIIGIAGASGAGKSLFAHQLLKYLVGRHTDQKVRILHEDCYYRRQDHLTYEQRCEINYDHPDALEHELLIEHLKSWRKGQSIQVPQYDYGNHNRSDKAETLQPSQLLILEGILIFFDPAVRELLDLSIFVDVPLDICLIRRLRRDINERKRSADSVLKQFEATVRPMYFQFVEPTKNYADLIVPHGGENNAALKVICNHLDKELNDLSPV